MNKKIILVPEELYNQIVDIAAEYSEAVEDMAEQLLNSQVTKYLSEKATMFYPGTKYTDDPKTMIQARMLESDVTRLQTWLQAKDSLDFLGCGKSELVIINKSMQKQTSEEKPMESSV